jgi:hypothetical protein
MLSASAWLPGFIRLHGLQCKHKNIHNKYFYADGSRFSSSRRECRVGLLFPFLNLPGKQIISTNVGKIVAKINEWPSGNYSFVFTESCLPGLSFHFPISILDWESRNSSIEFFPSKSLVMNSIDCYHSRISCNSPFFASGFHDLQICHHFCCDFWMGLNANCDGHILSWTWESKESVIEKSGEDLIYLQASMNGFKSARNEKFFCLWFYCNVFCELGLPPRYLILNSDDQGQREFPKYCGLTNECLINSVASYRLILKRGGGSRDGSQTGLPIYRDIQEMSDSTECGSDHRVAIASTVECIKRYEFVGLTSLRDILFPSDCHLKEIE